MIYHLFQYLESIGADFPGLGLMHYLSFRAMMAAVTAVLVAMYAGKRIIRLLQRAQDRGEDQEPAVLFLQLFVHGILRFAV